MRTSLIAAFLIVALAGSMFLFGNASAGDPVRSCGGKVDWECGYCYRSETDSTGTTTCYAGVVCWAYALGECATVPGK